MQDKEKVYRFRYTADNRIKSIHESNELKKESKAHWWVVIGGVVLAIVWVIIWA